MLHSRLLSCEGKKARTLPLDQTMIKTADVKSQRLEPPLQMCPINMQLAFIIPWPNCIYHGLWLLSEWLCILMCFHAHTKIEVFYSEIIL